jgi:hypothetical protein
LTSLQKWIVQLYHYLLCHPGINRTNETIGQHFYWPKMRYQITKDVSTCTICQTQKKQSKEYGFLLKSWSETTIIDPPNVWFKIKQYNDKKSIMVANIVTQEWLAWYLWPSLLTLDHRSKFIYQDFHDLCKNSCRIKIKKISTCNPQVNAIIKCAHQMLGNWIMSFQLQEKHLYDLDDPWVGILAAVAFALCLTYHTTLRAMF